ncbi:hypothetical protein ASF44_30280 [Pseudorhodoferax sp. Leaf274]|nr:hypothetical protein ASF44_30280 [Pseudorhodoferax sp. Leaf274]
MPVVVVLAAGRGTRFNADRTKLLALLRGKPVVAHAIDCARRSHLPLKIVLANDAPRTLIDAVSILVEARDIVWNANSALGVTHSIACGLAAAPDAANWIVLPGDMPNVQPDDVRAVLRALDEPDVLAARPTHAGEPGYPVGLSRRLGIDWSGSVASAGPLLLKALAHARRIADCSPGVVQDVDTVADLNGLAR